VIACHVALEVPVVLSVEYATRVHVPSGVFCCACFKHSLPLHMHNEFLWSSVVFLIQQPSRKRGCNCVPPINPALFVFLPRPQRHAATAVFAMSFDYEVGQRVMEHLLEYLRSTS